MRVVHKYKNYECSNETDNDNFLLTNKIGGFASMMQKNICKYQGISFQEDGETFKVVENISIPGEIVKTTNKFMQVEKETKTNKATFFMPHGMNAFFYQLENKAEIELSLDCRKYSDFREWGRHYSISTADNKIVVSYTKKTDKREDDSQGKREYEIYLAIIPDSFEYKLLEKFDNHTYSYDRERRSLSERHVFKALNINASKLFLGFGTTEKKAVENAENLKENIQQLMEEQEENLSLHTRMMPFKKELHAAYLCAQNSLNNLIVQAKDSEAILAGLYWFNQEWSRDELISVGALLKLQKYPLAKEILMKNLNRIQETGRLPNIYPSSELGSADSIGWLFKRFYDLIDLLLKKDLLYKNFDYKEIAYIKTKLENAISAARENHESEGLITNNRKETWMDSGNKINKDYREGVRLEIQTFYLMMYQLLERLCILTKDKIGAELAEHREKELLMLVRQRFWNGHYLNDGADDSTIRPNIFIAYYVYSELLTRSEWIDCFNNVLPRLWTGFGLTSIDKHDTRYVDHYTGEGDESYHRGDSWYFLNNMAAVCMRRLSNFRFKNHIRAIAKASTQDILWQGIPGCHSELSSSREQKAGGCFCQSWSNAMFIEMVNEVY